LIDIFLRTLVQVNKYDLDGNLKSSDIDSTSWEDRDTQNYSWSNKDEPPPEALAPPPPDDRIEQFFSSAEQQHQRTDGDQSALVLTTAADVPAVSWTGATASHQVKYVIQETQLLLKKPIVFRTMYGIAVDHCLVTMGDTSIDNTIYIARDNQSLLGQSVFKVVFFRLDASVKTSSPLPDSHVQNYGINST